MYDIVYIHRGAETGGCMLYSLFLIHIAVRMGISRGCGTKKVWERYTKPDAVCDGNTVGKFIS